MANRVSALLAAASALACTLAASLPAAGAPSSDATDPWSTAKHVRSESLRMDLQLCWASPAALMARSPQEWTDSMLGLKDALCVLPPAGAPPVDWTKHGVVLVARGDLPYGDVEVRELRRTGARLLVDVAYTSTSSGCGWCDYQLVLVPMPVLLRMESVEVRYNCVDCPMPGATGESTPVLAGGADRAVTSPTWGALKATYR